MKYLTSSQTLTFNMLSEITRRPEASAQLISALLGRADLAWLESADFEFSGADTPYWLGDRTFVDLLLRFRRADGGLLVVAIETKLADRFSTRKTKAMGGLLYQRLAQNRPIWKDLHASLENNTTRQMTRCHALAQSVQTIDCGHPEEGAALLMLLHPKDKNGIAQAKAYVGGLNTDDAVFATWDTFLRMAKQMCAMNDRLRRDLTLRYVTMDSSDGVWNDLFKVTSTDARRGP